MHEWKATGNIDVDTKYGLVWVQWECARCYKQVHVTASSPTRDLTDADCKVA